MCDDPARIRLEPGDVSEVLETFPADSFHGLLSDPPYGLGTGPGRPVWDGAVPSAEVWAEASRVLVPGAWVLAFGGRRTHHRLMVAMEEGGLELRDVLSWLYGTGMPSARTCLRPGWEPVVLARNPGPTQPLNIDACRLEGPIRPSDRRTSPRGTKTSWGTHGKPRSGPRHHPDGRWPSDVLLNHGPDCVPDGCAPRCPIHELDVSTDGASRFFYCAKPKGREAEGNPHPTRKPVDLCSYLARLILPEGGGRLLVPYSGSGSEVLGGLRAGWDEVVGIEQEQRWLEVARKRIGRDTGPTA